MIARPGLRANEIIVLCALSPKIFSVEKNQIDPDRRRIVFPDSRHLEQHGHARRAVVSANDRSRSKFFVGIVIGPRSRVVMSANHDSGFGRGTNSPDYIYEM